MQARREHIMEASGCSPLWPVSLVEAAGIAAVFSFSTCCSVARCSPVASLQSVQAAREPSSAAAYSISLFLSRDSSVSAVTSLRVHCKSVWRQGEAGVEQVVQQLPCLQRRL